MLACNDHVMPVVLCNDKIGICHCMHVLALAWNNNMHEHVITVHYYMVITLACTTVMACNDHASEIACNFL
jgi:hypothetical protein